MSAGRRPPAGPVGIGTDHDSADRPGHETGAERRQRQHQAGKLAMRGEKCVADLDREKAVGDEVIKFEHIADGRRQRAATDKRLLRLGCHVLRNVLCHPSH